MAKEETQVKTNLALLARPEEKICLEKKTEPYTVGELEAGMKCYRALYSDIKARYNALRITVKKREGIP